MDYSIVFAFSLLVLGLALIVAELFIPSGGVISILSIVCLGASVYCAHDAWWERNPNGFWWFVGSIVGLIPITVGGGLYLLANTRLGSRVFLDGPKLEEVTPYSHEAERRKQLIGKTGKTLTLMAPGGLVIVDGERWHAESEGQMLDPDESIQIVAVRGNRVLVRLQEAALPASIAPVQPEPDLTEEDTPPEEAEPADLTETRSDSKQVPLDFEIPES